MLKFQEGYYTTQYHWEVPSGDELVKNETTNLAEPHGRQDRKSEAVILESQRQSQRRS